MRPKEHWINLVTNISIVADFRDYHRDLESISSMAKICKYTLNSNIISESLLPLFGYAAVLEQGLSFYKKNYKK